MDDLTNGNPKQNGGYLIRHLSVTPSPRGRLLQHGCGEMNGYHHTRRGDHWSPAMANNLTKTKGGRGNPSPTVNWVTPRLRLNEQLPPYP